MATPRPGGGPPGAPAPSAHLPSDRAEPWPGAPAALAPDAPSPGSRAPAPSGGAPGAGEAASPRPPPAAAPPTPLGQGPPLGQGTPGGAAAAGSCPATPPQRPHDPLRSLGRQRAAAALTLACSVHDSQLRGVWFWRWRCWTLQRAARLGGDDEYEGEEAEWEQEETEDEEEETEEEEEEESPGSECGERRRPDDAPVCGLFGNRRCAPGTEHFVELANKMLGGHTVTELMTGGEIEELMRAFRATHERRTRSYADGPAGSGWADGIDPHACPEIVIGEQLCSGNPNAKRLPLTIVGDLHGQLRDLIKFILEPVAEGVERQTRFLFLGDYVDRGPDGLDVFCLLALLRVAYPECVTLLRGNHEDAQTSVAYGFFEECRAKYPPSPDSGDDPSAVWHAVNSAWPCMPVAAVVRHKASRRKVWCCHGGLAPKLAERLGPDPREAVLRSQHRRYGEHRYSGYSGWEGAPPQRSSQELVDGLLWSDPVDSAPSGGQCVAPHFWRSDRGVGYLWTEAASITFCEEHHIDFICRAHQMVMPGFEWTHSNKVLTIFSAANYCHVAGNSGAVLVVDSAWWAVDALPSPRTWAPLPASPPPYPAASPGAAPALPPAVGRYFTGEDEGAEEEEEEGEGEEEEEKEDEEADEQRGEDGAEEEWEDEVEEEDADEKGEEDEEEEDDSELQWGDALGGYGGYMTIHWAITLQRWYRRWGAVPKRLAAECMQRFARCCAARSELRRRREASAELLRRRVALEQQGWAAVGLQRAWRAAQERAARLLQQGGGPVGRAGGSGSRPPPPPAPVPLSSPASAASAAPLSKHMKKQLAKRQTRAWRLRKVRGRAAAAAAQRAAQRAAQAAAQLAAPPAQVADGAPALPRDGGPGFEPRPPRSLLAPLPLLADEAAQEGAALESAAGPAAAAVRRAAGPGGEAGNEAPLGEQSGGQHSRWMGFADADV